MIECIILSMNGNKKYTIFFSNINQKIESQKIRIYYIGSWLVFY